MGMRDFLDKMKQKAEERLNPKPLTPEEEKARKQANARKQFEQLNSAIEFGKKAIKIKKDVDGKVDAIKDGIAEKTIKIVDKIEGNASDAAPAQPAESKAKDDAPKTLGMISKGIGKGLGAVRSAGDAVKKAGGTVADKAKGLADAQREAAARKPSTRSGILDMIVPAVPDTKATAPKKPAADQPAPKAPRTRKPK